MAVIIDNSQRALKKYEAEPLAIKSQGGKFAQDFYSPFGPQIAKARLSDTLIEQLNSQVDAEFSRNESLQSGREVILPDSLVSAGGDASLGYILAQHIMGYAEETEGQKVKSLEYETLWAVSQYANTPSPMHFHSTDISGVFYLKVPELNESEACEQTRNYIGGRKAGYLNFMTGGKQAFNKSLMSVKPEVGDLYIFPGWLLHGVEAFAGEGERRSVAFNANVTF
ncbi:hypothetical protein R50073_26200 [Maricurvus nonylphenolicus]|uniref:putative 2OG-Fe(II) oxygenase n=1 Tax=Maricurvus nonylphenolicus TaxID=1008307 RepID=UPI0036F29C4A